MIEGAARRAAWEAYCRELRLPRRARSWEEWVRQGVQDAWPYAVFLVHLLETAVQERRVAFVRAADLV